MNVPNGYPDEIAEDYMECIECGDEYPESAIVDGVCPYCNE